jgi:hypothetical protein
MLPGQIDSFGLWRLHQLFAHLLSSLPGRVMKAHGNESPMNLIYGMLIEGSVAWLISAFSTTGAYVVAVGIELVGRLYSNRLVFSETQLLVFSLRVKASCCFGQSSRKVRG